MNSIATVANYIITKRGNISTVKLQFICYYALAWSLVWDKHPMFDDQFQAYPIGPICPELLKATGHATINGQPVHTFVASKIPDDGRLTEDQKYTIDAVLDRFGDNNIQQLSSLTRTEKPWQQARGEVPSGHPCTAIIPQSTIKAYYDSL